MKALAAILLVANILLAQGTKQEIEHELKQLEQMRSYIEEQIKKNKAILSKIEKEKAALEKLEEKIKKEQKEIAKERYKKLAKDFENMDPEYAGEKLSKMQDPKIAAYILYNMNPRKAGEALNYTDPTMVNKITEILTQLRKNAR